MSRIIKAIFRTILISAVNLFYRLLFKVKHSCKKKNILIYTDSRGFLVDCLFCNKTPYKSYIEKLSSEYNIEYQLCTHKHTTILDFLNFISKKDVESYSTIILHLGIVDYSPRPINQLKIVYEKKIDIARKLIPDLKMLPNYYEDEYDGQKTFSLYDFAFLEQILVKLNNISNDTKIIWIGLNTVDLDWDGNYFKKRPKNINIILKYQKYIEEYLAVHKNNIEYININKLKNFNLKTHTLDNMHLSEEGFTFFYNLLKEKLIK